MKELLQLRCTLSGHHESIERIAWSHDGKRIWSASNDKTVIGWDIASHKQLFRLSKHKKGVLGIALTPNNVITGGWDNTLWVFDKAGRPIFCKEHTGAVASIVPLGDKRLIAYVCDDKTVRVLDVENRVERYHSDLYKGDHVNSVVALPDDRLVVAAYPPDDILKIHDFSTGNTVPLMSESDPNKPVYALALAPDGYKLAWAFYHSEETDIHLMDVEGRRSLISIPKAHGDIITSLSFSYDGLLLASKSHDHTVKIWNANDGSLLQIIDEPYSGQSIFAEVAFHPSRPHLATLGNCDKDIRIWDMDAKALPIDSYHRTSKLRDKIMPIGELNVSTSRNGLTPVSVFLSSPIDVKEERERAKLVIEELNRDYAEEHGLTIKLKDWETGAFSDAGIPMENIVRDMDPANSDIFIGIIWMRFGSPTGVIDPKTKRPYQSGTELEFKRAYEKRKSRGDWPKVTFFRRVSTPKDFDLTTLDLGQFTQVEEFFKNFLPDGEHPGLVKHYSTPEEFERHVRSHLLHYLRKFANEHRSKLLSR